jgi:hypothetical protein
MLYLKGVIKNIRILKNLKKQWKNVDGRWDSLYVSISVI